MNQILTKKFKRAMKRNITGWLFSLWPFIGYCIFSGIPFVMSIVLSFMELHSFDITQMEFVGLKNFIWIFTDPKGEFWFSLRQTLYYFLSLPIGLVLGLGMAVLLNHNVKGTKLFRTILFIPNVCSVIAISLMWRLVFSQNSGVLNSFLNLLGTDPSKNIDWFKDPNWFMPCVLFTTTWGAGAGSLMFQAALAQVNPSLIEAAKIDGASNRRILFSVTLPAISPTTFYVLVMNTISALQTFANIQIISGGSNAPFDPATGNSIPLTTMYLIYWMGFKDPFNYGLGLASAASWILTIFVVGLTIIYFKTSKYWVHYDE